jgi:hypothetical protein
MINRTDNPVMRFVVGPLSLLAICFWRRDVAPHPQRNRAATGDEAGGGGEGGIASNLGAPDADAARSPASFGGDFLSWRVH